MNVFLFSTTTSACHRPPLSLPQLQSIYTLLVFESRSPGLFSIQRCFPLPYSPGFAASLSSVHHLSPMNDPRALAAGSLCSLVKAQWPCGDPGFQILLLFICRGKCAGSRWVKFQTLLVFPSQNWPEEGWIDLKPNPESATFPCAVFILHIPCMEYWPQESLSTSTSEIVRWETWARPVVYEEHRKI